FRSASSGRRNPRRRWPGPAACRTSSSTDGAAAAPWRPRRSMPSRTRSSEPMIKHDSIRLFGLGLGPGDPDYMTVRARKVLESADRLVHFCKRGRRGNARVIADAVVGQNPDREIALVYPVTTEIPADHRDYAAALN